MSQWGNTDFTHSSPTALRDRLMLGNYLEPRLQIRPHRPPLTHHQCCIRSGRHQLAGCKFSTQAPDRVLEFQKQLDIHTLGMNACRSLHCVKSFMMNGPKETAQNYLEKKPGSIDLH